MNFIISYYLVLHERHKWARKTVRFYICGSFTQKCHRSTTTIIKNILKIQKNIWKIHFLRNVFRQYMISFSRNVFVNSCDAKTDLIIEIKLHNKSFIQNHTHQIMSKSYFNIMMFEHFSRTFGFCCFLFRTRCTKEVYHSFRLCMKTEIPPTYWNESTGVGDGNPCSAELPPSCDVAPTPFETVPSGFPGLPAPRCGGRITENWKKTTGKGIIYFSVNCHRYYHILGYLPYCFFPCKLEWR